MSFQLTLKQEQFNRLYPFFMFIDEGMTIESKGNSLEKLIGKSATSFIENFIIKRPYVELLNKKSLLKVCGELVLLETLKNPKIILRGQLEYIEEKNGFIFIGSPWVLSTEELHQSGLSIKDLSSHDALLDMLHLLQSSSIVNTELKELLIQVNKQKEDLKKSAQQIQDYSRSLQISNQRYELVSKATSEAIWDWDLINNNVYYGEGFSRVFGYDLNDLEHNIEFWQNNVHPDDYEMLMNSVEQVLQGDMNIWSGEYRFRKSDGKYSSVFGNSYVLRNENGRAVKMIGALQDITIKKKEEQHLKLLESVVEKTNDSVIIMSSKENLPILYVNEAFTKITGYNRDEVIGQSPIMLSGPKSDPKTVERIISQIIKFESSEATVIAYKKNKEPIWVNFTLNPVTNQRGRVSHWISIQRDITEMVNANREIEVQKKFTEDILNNIPADIAVFDKSHNYLFLNPNAIKDKEKRQWLIGKNDFDYAKHFGIDDTIAKRRRDLYDQAIEEKRVVDWIDEHKTKAGELKYVLRNFYPYFEEEDLKYMIGYGVDITETKIAERRLQEALEALKAVNIELEQFAYIASHDLQEPLRMVTSFLSQLEKKYSGVIDEKGKEYIHYAVDGAKRMRQIILDLLEFSRIGRTEESLKDVDLNIIINEIVLLHSKQMDELNAIITFDNLPVLKTYKSPIRQVFQNLINNGLKYHRKGIQPLIHVEAKEGNDFWQFSVSDNGLGIDEQYYEKIFVIFQRLHNRDEYSGTGIGLAITKKIIENLGGKIWVTSTPNQGSVFHFTIKKQ
ncbi:MAG: PAS domain S-box protein [Ferruginibacter sp.]|nr:PAS domain S-box protein [Ferruginibacter sp.]